MNTGNPDLPPEEDAVEATVTALEAEQMRAAEATSAAEAGPEQETPAEEEFDRATGAVFGKP